MLRQPLAALPASPQQCQLQGSAGGSQDRQEGRGEDLHGHGGVRLVWRGCLSIPQPPASCRGSSSSSPAQQLCQFSEQRPSSMSSEQSRWGWGCCRGTPWGPLLLLVENPVGITPNPRRAGPSQPGKWDAGAAALGPLSTGCSYFGCRVYRLRNAAGGRCLRVTPGPSGPRLRAGPAERGWGRRGRAETPPWCWGGAAFRQPRRGHRASSPKRCRL